MRPAWARGAHICLRSVHTHPRRPSAALTAQHCRRVCSIVSTLVVGCVRVVCTAKRRAWPYPHASCNCGITSKLCARVCIIGLVQTVSGRRPRGGVFVTTRRRTRSSSDTFAVRACARAAAVVHCAYTGGTLLCVHTTLPSTIAHATAGGLVELRMAQSLSAGLLW